MLNIVKSVLQTGKRQEIFCFVKCSNDYYANKHVNGKYLN